MHKIEPGPQRAAELDAEQMVAITMQAAAASCRALRAGSIAPSFRLRDHGGREVSLRKLMVAGPTIVHFYRGSWCTYCQDGLSDLATAHQGIRAAGGRVLAIAPPPSPQFLEGVQRDTARLPFTALIDEGMKVAVAYGVAYRLPDQLRPSYLQRGYAPPRSANSGEWLVPIPATFLIGTDGTIVLSVVDVDYRNRLHSEQLLSALKGMRGRTNA
jgi:peroxiredoxin